MYCTNDQSTYALFGSLANNPFELDVSGILLKLLLSSSIPARPVCEALFSNQLIQ